MAYRKVLAAGLAVIVTLASGCSRSRVQPSHGDSAAALALRGRIESVERGLIPLDGPDSISPRAASIQERMRHYHVPGVSLAVIEGGRIDWAHAYGVLRAGRPEPVDTASLFQAASISKPVTTVAILNLVDHGRLALDEDVNLRLTSWHIPRSDHTREEKVTLRRILTHSAGLTVSGFAGYLPGEPVPTLNQVLDGLPPANSPPIRVEFVPGTSQRYSGGGFEVAQLLVAERTARPFPAALRDLVLAPAGMVHSTFEQPLPARLEPLAASGHDSSGDEVPGRWRVHPEQAAAGLWTTPSDLARLAIAIQNAKTMHGGGILSRAMVTEMLTPQLGPSGLGFVIVGEGEERIFRHGGSNAGFRAQMVAFVTGGRGAVVMTNGEGGMELTDEIIDSIARAYHWPTRKIR